MAKRVTIARKVGSGDQERTVEYTTTLQNFELNYKDKGFKIVGDAGEGPTPEEETAKAPSKPAGAPRPLAGATSDKDGD